MSYGLSLCWMYPLPLSRLPSAPSYLPYWCFSFLPCPSSSLSRSSVCVLPFIPGSFFSTTHPQFLRSPLRKRGSFTRSGTRPLLPGPCVKATLKILTLQRGCHDSLTSLLRILSPTYITLDPWWIRSARPTLLVPRALPSASVRVSNRSRHRRLLCALWGGAVRK